MVGTPLRACDPCPHQFGIQHRASVAQRLQVALCVEQVDPAVEEVQQGGRHPLLLHLLLDEPLEELEGPVVVVVAGMVVDMVMPPA